MLSIARSLLKTCIISLLCVTDLPVSALWSAVFSQKISLNKCKQARTSPGSQLSQARTSPGSPTLALVRGPLCVTHRGRSFFFNRAFAVVPTQERQQPPDATDPQRHAPRLCESFCRCASFFEQADPVIPRKTLKLQRAPRRGRPGSQLSQLSH